MSDLAAAWNTALPTIRDSVTGVGVWTALNACRAIAFEDGVLVLGLPEHESELAGHLKLPAARKAIEDAMGPALGTTITVRIIAGIGLDDWTAAKESDAVKRRLAEQAVQRAKAEVNSRSSWETMYDKLSRKFAETPNRSLPQNRARFFLEAVEIVSTALIETPITDDMAERNFARCIERIAQYCEIPSTLVATKVLEKAFQG